ncbi:MAG: nickel pincer cofactor biosynthesis protein LarB [Spirochaetales bacterium]|jgi:NCAIR mutase (PurE)-related protein|nr:nickel pincer cofactor biosynthesis protein LarB [Spirochaetales bacterium]
MTEKGTLEEEIAPIACTEGTGPDLARLDLLREERAGIPEVILSAGKRPRDVIRLLKVLALKKGLAMATKAGRRCLAMAGRENDRELNIEVYYRAKVIVARRKDYSFPLPQALVGILAAGTADVGIAEEARITLQVLGCKAMVAYDVGVAGIHRLLQPLQEMKAKRVQVIIVVAGMEGALASVVKGLVPVPVIGVPTSVGYGYGGGGQAALMCMLQSCSPGLVVVNIDNGFGAAAAAALMAGRGWERVKGEMR